MFTVTEDKRDFLYRGKEYEGEIRGERERGYLQDFDEWRKTGIDPRGGSFAFREYQITERQYNAAIPLTVRWDQPYSLKCMCGTYTQQVIRSTGNKIGTPSPYSGLPKAMFREFGGTFAEIETEFY